MANSTTIPRDNVARALRFYNSLLNYPLSTGGSFDFQQGDLLWWDSAAGYVKPLDSDAHAATLVGVALRSSYVAPYSSVVQAGGPGIVKNYCDSALIGFGLIATLFTTVGDTYVDGTAVYAGADAQTITAVAGSHQVGVVKQVPGTAPLGSVAGASGVLVPVLVIPQTPIQTL